MKLRPPWGVAAESKRDGQTCVSVFLWPLSQKQQQTGPDLNLHSPLLPEGYRATAEAETEQRGLSR